MKFDITKVLLVTDLDGTLLPHNKELSEKDINAINKLRQSGGKFTFATGRVLPASEKYFNALSIDIPVILNNGGEIYDCVKKKYVVKYLLPASARIFLDAVIKNCPEVGVEVSTENQIYVAKMTELENYHIKITGVNVLEKSLDNIPDGWLKVVLTMDNEYIPKFRHFIADNDVGNINYINSGPIFIELLPENCCKGNALKKLVNVCGYEDYTIVAVGDYMNDIEMLQYADVGVAPFNAIEQVKRAVDIVTQSDCNNGAISEVIDYIFLNRI